MLISYDVFTALINHPKLIARFPGVTVLTSKMLETSMALLFGIENLYVSKAQYTATDL